jgi:hypothetical protein
METNKVKITEDHVWTDPIDEINERLKKKDYILTVYQTGDKELSDGDQKRQVQTSRFYVVCSLEEIPEYIKYMKQPFWGHEEGLSKKEIKNYPYEKKKWGRYWNVIIEPLSEEMEKDYLSGIKDGFFRTWRRIHKRDTERK